MLVFIENSNSNLLYLAFHQITKIFRTVTATKLTIVSGTWSIEERKLRPWLEEAGITVVNEALDQRLTVLTENEATRDACHLAILDAVKDPEISDVIFFATAAFIKMVLKELVNLNVLIRLALPAGTVVTIDTKTNKYKFYQPSKEE